MKILTYLTFMFVVSCTVQCHAAVYQGVAVDETTGEPVEGLRILCRQFVVDHGFWNHLRARVIGHDFADVDSSIMDAVVTGVDGMFTLSGDGIPMRSVSINKNGEYGIFGSHNLAAHGLIIRIKDQPLRSDESKTETYQILPETSERGFVVFATDGIGNGYVFSLDSLTGAVVWKDCIFWEATTPVVLRNGRAFVGTDGGIIFAYSLATGKRLWEYQTGQEVVAFELDDRSVYVGGHGDGEVLLVIDQKTGRTQRTLDTDSRITGLRVDDGRLRISSRKSISLFLLPSLRRVKDRQFSVVKPPVVSSDIVTYADYVYLRTADHKVRCMNKEGNLLWESSDVGHAHEPMELAASAKSLFVVGRGALSCLDAMGAGEILWTYSGRDRTSVRGTPVVAGGGVFIREEIGHVTRISPDTGKAIWRFRCYGRVRKPVSYIKR